MRKMQSLQCATWITTCTLVLSLVSDSSASNTSVIHFVSRVDLTPSTLNSTVTIEFQLPVVDNEVEDSFNDDKYLLLEEMILRMLNARHKRTTLSVLSTLLQTTTRTAEITAETTTVVSESPTTAETTTTVAPTTSLEVTTQELVTVADADDAAAADTTDLLMTSETSTIESTTTLPETTTSEISTAADTTTFEPSTSEILTVAATTVDPSPSAETTITESPTASPPPTSTTPEPESATLVDSTTTSALLLTTETTVNESTTTPPASQTTTEMVVTALPTTTEWVPLKRRRRRDVDTAGDDEYVWTVDDVHFVLLEPKVKGDVARVSIFLNKTGSGTVDPDLLWNVTLQLYRDNVFKTELEFDVDSEQRGIYRGLPLDDDSAAVTSLPVLVAKWEFFVPLLVLLICFIVLLFAIICYVQHRKQRSSVREKLPEVEANYQKLGATPLSPSGDQPSPADDSNTCEIDWIIPYEQAILLHKSKLSDTTAPQEKTFL